MIRIQQIKVKPECGKDILLKKTAKSLQIKESEIKSLQVVKRSLDARKKPDLFYSYTVDVVVANEELVLRKCRDAVQVSEKNYQFPVVDNLMIKKRPVVVGMGPAGLFCAYFLAKAGMKPYLFERGKDVDARQKDVDAFWENGTLNPESNVQFGEGGAGTFSDGKLNTLVKDKYGRNKEVLRLFVEFGAPGEIFYESKPHIGTDILCLVVKNMREEIIRLGGEVFFESQVTELFTEDNQITGVRINGQETIETDRVVLAIGHSARNTFSMLLEKKIPMEAKPFAVGFRVEHRQEMINESQYGVGYPWMLPAAPYKVAAKTKDGRGVYSFCMCPGGYVVNASSEEGRLCVNGMSYSKRDGANANSAIIVTVDPKDFPSEHPLAGIAFQRTLEEKAYSVGNGKVPVQTYGSFKQNMEVSGQGVQPDFGMQFAPKIKGQYVFADLREILPNAVNRGIIEGMEQFAGKIKGFNKPDTLLCGVESRTSSPVRILRDEESLQSAIRGLYPCGEGAGYAGGITSAAMDGIKIAEAIAIDAGGKIK